MWQIADPGMTDYPGLVVLPQQELLGDTFITTVKSPLAYSTTHKATKAVGFVASSHRPPF